MNIRLSQKNAFKLGSDDSNGKKKSAQICKASGAQTALWVSSEPLFEEKLQVYTADRWRKMKAVNARKTSATSNLQTQFEESILSFHQT